jgi:hypothetical protein
MKKHVYARTKKLSIALCLGVAACFSANAAHAADHPYYLHALSDLRAARWMIEHRPGNWERTIDEINAVKEIDAAIKEIKEASIEDNKNIDDHPPVDEKNDHNGRLHEAVDFLKKAHEDINHEEDDSFARGLRNHSFKHIDLAIVAVKNAIHA